MISYTSSHFFSLLIALAIIACQPNDQTHNGDKVDSLYIGFQHPPAEAKPFVRWWWNGDKVTAKEIDRQLDVLSRAGIGGVEINPIAFPEQADDLGIASVPWLSKEWNDLLAHAAKGAQSRGMIADMIVGSGWPFGGEFLEKEETIQRIINHAISLKGGREFSATTSDLIQQAVSAQKRQYKEVPLDNRIFFVRLIPDSLTNTGQVMDLIDKYQAGTLKFQVPAGNYQLVYGVHQFGHREVMHGAPGAAGPVMDHYKKEVTLSYLARLKKISEDTGIPLQELVRALFCDSIELAGANWTDGFDTAFKSTYGYALAPYYPFIFYDPYAGYAEVNGTPEFRDEIRRVRFDYNRLLVETFLENFTEPFQEFCTEHGLKARYQAYGTPFLMGMMQGNMIADIPESNNWMYSSDMDSAVWNWNQGHGYMIWNLYAAAGGHLTDRSIISCEAMTNTKAVFKMSLDEIKVHDDMNFITGINHSVLHGYNYSPIEAGLPGWIRYGGYFSEKNTWWPYFPKWVEYNSRLSYVFQNSTPVKKIAIIGPQHDLWSEKGLTREPFHLDPWYVHRIWEGISQAGSSFEYISEDILIDANVSDGTISYGPMNYEALVMCDLRSIKPESVKALEKYLASGGKVVFVGQVPQQSLSLTNAILNDQEVLSGIDRIRQTYPDRLLVMDPPANSKALLGWSETLLQQLNLSKDVTIDRPMDYVYQIREQIQARDIYFFTNVHRSAEANLNLTFPVAGKNIWRWDPETGKGWLLKAAQEENALLLYLGPMESALLVLDPSDADGEKIIEQSNQPGNILSSLDGSWQVTFNHMNGDSFERQFESLQDFVNSSDPVVRDFAGTVHYKRTFTATGNERWLDLGNVNRGITEVKLNGQDLGTSWYGKHLYDLQDTINPGENELEVIYTTVLANYCKSLTDNKTASHWTDSYGPVSTGMEGPVTFRE